MKCDWCGKDLEEDEMPFKCKFCSRYFCSEHRLPENHECQGLEEYKKEKVEKSDFTYEPFKEENFEKKKTQQEEFIKNLSRVMDNLNKIQSPGSFYKYLIGICLVSFILQQVIPGFTEMFYMDPVFSQVIVKPWMFVTSIFLHGNFWHLFVNLIVLYFFGGELERRIGSTNFLMIFLSSGIIASFGHLIYSFFTSPVPAVGASGALFGVFATLAIIAPEIKVLFFFFIPMRIKYALIFFVIYNLILITQETMIASAAHLTGILVGLMFGFYFKERYGSEQFLRFRF